ncbi:MAG: DEAD/DEAH box helicase family protein [Eubacterium sp.]|nr:DEAD/DEAH box helicase family protein [Eubacterium sp.]
MNKFYEISQKEEFKNIYSLCEELENTASAEEQAKLCRDILEETIKYIYKKECRKHPVNATLLELIDGEVISGFVCNAIILDSLHFVRKLGMNAIHDLKITRKQSKIATDNIAFFLEFVVHKYEDDLKTEDIVLPKYMTEAETRKIYIDLYLSEAGWEVVEPMGTTTLANGTEVKSGSIIPGKACCEIPVTGINGVEGKMGFCDYVLYGKDGKPLAIVEAKRADAEAGVGQFQVKQYGECMEKEYGYVPVLYYTNGYEIYVIDGLYPARKVMAFHTLDELEYMIQRRGRDSIVDLTINDDIAGRYYQKMAVTSVCERFNEKQRRCLLVMATGTGKTRVSISLVDVLLRNKWIKNILFLADRTSLVSQAFKNFQKLLPDMSYCVLSDKSLADEPNARLVFSTHQTMINYIDAEDKEFSAGRFDLIIIDEAHRSVFNKYGSIFDYFDSLLVGLTATPKDQVDANTYELFNCESGHPNYAYSMDEAVKDKYLVPFNINTKTTKLLSGGIRYGDLSPEDKAKIESAMLFDDSEINEDFIIPKEKLFKVLYNVDTCSKVLDDLLENGYRVDGGQKLGKTIIFAYNHKHAQMIVDTFKKNYPALGNEYCQLIDNQVKNANELINRFETEDKFRIAVSVDMLDTGIDVPAVLNLVFFKPIRSKIKFIQMIGRGTRLCPNLIDGKDKTDFMIFDYCNNFEFFDIHIGGKETSNSKSLSQKLFDLKLDILVELQKYQYQVNEKYKAYYDKLKTELYEKVKEIKRGSERIAVRKKMDIVDKYIDVEIWRSLSQLEKKEMQFHLSPLVANDQDEKVSALRFDMQMLFVELSVLENGDISKAHNSVNRVRKISKALLDRAGSLDEIIEKGDILLELVSADFWSTVTVDTLEEYRKEVRHLLEYLVGSGPTVDINLIDEVNDTEYTGDGLIDIRTYKEKVLDYLLKNSNNATIQKIKNLEQINAEDLKELERILWHELGTETEYHNATSINNLAAFIRSIVGIEQNIINEKFGEFLSGNLLNSQQQEFVKAIIDYVRENGDIEMIDLIEKSPFDHYDILSLFGDNIVNLKSMVEHLHNAVIAA